ncbi:hypothetical protein M8C21_010047, partial [Ambrosia artemisiifolia]
MASPLPTLQSGTTIDHVQTLKMASPLPTLQSGTTTIDNVGEDLLQNIVARLPALSFASVACVSRSWNLVCSRILCRPKLSSACSFNPSLHLAVAEVVAEVLSQPIRPHFAIASVGPSFSRLEAYELITAKLGSKVPLVTNCSSGIIGRDVLSHEFKEWKVTEEDDDLLEDNDDMEGTNKAIMLVVGFLPGMKVGTIPLLKQYDEACPCAVKIDKFITDIREFSTSISGCTSPAAIIMFCSSILSFVLDCAMSPETVIVGDCCCYFIHASKSSRNIAPRYERVPAGVALYFLDNQETLLVNGVGINTGDTFRVYHPHSTTSLSSVANVSDHMRSFKQGSTNGGDRLEVVGGLIFASVGRGESFFGQPNVDSSPFLENFPDVALGGMLCAREIGRGNLSPYVKESEEQK